MLFLLLRRVISLLAAATMLVAGLAGAYSYGQAYSQHRGFAMVLKIPRAGTGRLMNVNFYSRALHRRAYYLAYLPPGYKASNHDPVLYLLHGMPGKPEVFINIANLDVRLDNQLSEGHLRPMIMVFPDGRIDGSVYTDSEWANTPSGDFASYVTEVVKDVDARFSTLPRRQDRVIGGFSAGAYGAINIALHHLPVFGSVEVWSGYFTQTRTGVFAHASRHALLNNSPLDYVSRLKPELAANPLRVFMFVGRDDEASVQIAPMARALNRAGARATYAVYPGGHDWDVWYPRLNQMLILASRDFSKPLPAPRSTTRRRSRAVALGARRRGRRNADRAVVRRRHTRGAVDRGPRPLPSRLERAFAPLTRRPAESLGSGSDQLLLIGALLLALLSAAAINVGFLLQHRALAGQADGARALIGMLSNRTWLAGQAVGWVGFAGSLMAVALAPLSLVQAFAAGGLAISLPIAARMFGQPVSRRQLLAISVMAVALTSLPIALVSHSNLHGGTLLLMSLTLLAVATAIGVNGGPAAQAIAAGCAYAVADAAIKAISTGWHAHGFAALVSVWAVLAVVGTFAGFLAFQSSLRRGSAVVAISLMNVFAALGALACGILAFGEALGTGPSATVVHLLAISLVLTSVPLLAAGQQRIAGSGRTLAPVRVERRRAIPRLRAGLPGKLRGLAVKVLLLLSVFVGVGLLYAIRGLGWLPVGPRVPDSLPLLALAHHDAQPLARVVLVWVATGAAFGLLIVWIAPRRRALAALLPALILLLIASDASFALAENLRLGSVLWGRVPPSGAWVEALLFALGAAIPEAIVRLPKPRASWSLRRPGAILAPLLRL
ncbi:MAG TPA: alpha/beta hydrolase-fold protein [Solirubrobacteraceae bacterium]|nr:alpha/beta hydrolase-fold protein [Solirubrobacteraceae bacterium]